MQKIISFFLLTILLFSCAEIVPPTGGTKDVTPPKVKKSFPENFTTNFDYSKIELKFDEFIKLNSGGNNIIISPNLEKKTKIDLIGKKVIINFQEELLKNTTYIINFGSSIKDNNEGNLLKDYKYIFSTGSYIDSLMIKGNVLDAITKKPVKDILVGIYPEYEDSVLYKKPLYYSKTDDAGNYSLENIKPNNYRIAALNDKNLNFIFDQENEEIAFSDSLINLVENKKIEPLLLYQNIEKTRIKEYLNKEENHIIFDFNKSFLDLEITIDTYNENEIIYYSLDKKHLHYWYLDKDTTKTNIYIKTNKEIKDSFSLNLKNNSLSKPFPYKVVSKKSEKNNSFLLKFPFPISDFDLSKLTIFNNNKEVPFTTNWFNNDLELEIKTKTLFDSLILDIKEECFTSFHKLNSIAIIDTIYDFNNQLSSLIINLKNEDNLIVEIYNDNDKLEAVKNVSRETKIIFNNLNQGNYIIRVYKDENNDGIWNSGLFHVKQQPEKTLIYQSIELKDNWDKEIDINF